MTPESCGGETSTSAYGNLKAALAAPRRSVHHNDALWYRVRRAPHLSHRALLPSLYEISVREDYSKSASSSYLEGHEVLIVLASKT